MAQIKRHASAKWLGTGMEGTGSLTTQSATLKDTPYGFKSRFGDGKGTNPEELIAAAHAGCFSMATAFQLSGAGHVPESLECNATLSMDQVEGGFKITNLMGTKAKAIPISVINAVIDLDFVRGPADHRASDEVVELD